MSLRDINTSELEEILKIINSKYISINSSKRRENIKKLNVILNELTDIMKSLDPLFKKLYERNFFGGSYYNGSKVEKPDEFDIDIILVLPKQCDTCRRKNCGCVEITSDKSHSGWLKFKIKEGFYWWKGLVTKSLNRIRENDNIRISESGPALIIILPHNDIHVDLVPSFMFSNAEWPKKFRSNPFASSPLQKLTTFLLVPKAPCSNRYDLWRASFQEQENELIKGKEKLKPALKLLKKMRSSMNRVQISSYYLKTIVLENVNDITSKSTLTQAFLLYLDKYQDCLYNKKIPYYWYSEANLLKNVEPDVIEQHYNQLSKKIDKFKREYECNPLVIAEIILNKSEYKDFEKYYKELRCSNQSNYDHVQNTQSLNTNVSGYSESQQDDSSHIGLWMGLAALGIGVIGGIAYAAATRRPRRK
ncbi:cyclic GMP-AMP synthase-like receptor isoform X2 [Rhynchophorus ferrugineus]|uniref:cyclic GMP-AMP synthase-like receptor isoform X2 n=1 Tax=Rhynchophorus ferrugineus TaxID=354439 RepID=UPI003FCD9AE8